MTLPKRKTVRSGLVFLWAISSGLVSGYGQPQSPGFEEVTAGAGGAKNIAGGTAGAQDSADEAPAPAARPWQEVYEGVQVYTAGGHVWAVYGKPMTAGATPADAAERWQTEFAGTLGVPAPDLHLDRSDAVHGGRFTVLAYRQFMDGLPVENGLARLVVLNGAPDRVVYVAAKLARPPASGFRGDSVDAATALASVRQLRPYSALTDWSAPEMVVFYGGEEPESHPAVRTWKFTGSRTLWGGPEAYTFFVDASDGRLVHVRDEIYHAEVTGHVSGYATPGMLPDVAHNPPTEVSLAGGLVGVENGPATLTDGSGDYVLSFGDTSPVLVQAFLVGEWVYAIDYSTLDTLHLSETVSPPASLDFLFNPAPAEFPTAVVNGFVRTNTAHDFYKARQPDFVGLDFPVYCVVNYVDTCNAFYMNNSGYHYIVFFYAGEVCPNTAYGNVVAHEYGHFIVNQLGLGQGAFGEGFGDSVGLLIYDDPVMGREWRGPGTFVRDIELANQQYPCEGEIHYCGQVLAGCWWDIRQELQATLGDPEALAVAQQLFTDWSQITLGGSGGDSAYPLTEVEALVADDDDGDLSNGTPHACEIVRGFRAHGIDTFAVLVDCNGNGTPDVCEGPEDCNTNGLRDLCDIVLGTSADCNLDHVPDECELAGNDCNGDAIPDECELAGNDCNDNAIPDDCDTAVGTSGDCQPNGVPDECEADCNHNDIPDECDIAAGTSADCTGNGIPDECETDCNKNGVRDDCDIAAGTSADCTGNGIPDECEMDCNTNGLRDDCDIAAGTSGDCNLNGIPDECDARRCYPLWNGFQGLAYQLPMNGVDLDGDGVAWVNPADTAKIWLYGCEFAGASDRSVQVTVTTTPPEEGYVVSEYFQSDHGVLPPNAHVYELSFKPRLEGYLNPKTDWQLFLYDAALVKAVIEIELTSTGSLRVPADQRGKVLVKNPSAPGFINTGVTLALNRCYDFKVVLDRLAGTVQLYIDGVARLDPPVSPLEVWAGRLDYLWVQAVSNELGSGGNTALKLDDFELCVNGGETLPQAEYDCNRNGTLDECDIGAGTSADLNTNGVPDECEICGDLDGDLDVDAEDYRLFVAAFGHSLGQPAYLAEADLDGDGTVTFLDYQRWLQCYRDFVGNPLAPPPPLEPPGTSAPDGRRYPGDFRR